MSTALERRNQLEEEFQTVLLDGIQVAIRGGKILSAIREERLWKDDYESFDDYCEQLWCLNREIAIMWIRAWEVARTASGTDDVMAPYFFESIEGMSLSAAQALYRVDPDVRRAVWSEAKEASPSPTARAIDAVADKHSKLLRDVDHMTVDEEQTFLTNVSTEIRQETLVVRAMQTEGVAQKKLRAIWRIVNPFAESSEKLGRVKAKLDEAMEILREAETIRIDP